MYTGHMICVAWNGVASDFFHILNGVQQGGVISPVLFCIYIDGLLIRLRSSGVGCYIGAVFTGVLAYADDLVLVAPTPSALRRMLSICDDYASEFDILFNAKKSKCIIALPKSKRSLLKFYNKCDFRINGSVIDIVPSWPHLGHIINSELTDDDDIQNRCGSLIGQTNSLLCYFNKLNSRAKGILFKAYCYSMYGCELWAYDNEKIETFNITVRKGLRRVWGLPNTAHKDLIYQLSDMLPTFDEICRRGSNFIHNYVLHGSVLVKFILRHAIQAQASSPTGSNWIFNCLRYGFRIRDLFDDTFTRNLVDVKCKNGLSSSVRTVSSLLYECILLRDNILQLPHNFLSRDNIVFLVDYLATCNLN